MGGDEKGYGDNSQRESFSIDLTGEGAIGEAGNEDV